MSRRAALRFSDAAREALAAIAKAENFRSKRRDDYENAIKTFIDWRGADPLLGDVTPEIAGDYQVALGQYPTNVRKRPAYRDLASFAERCARAEELNDPDLLGAETINGKYLTPLRRIYAWHEKAGSGLKNPFTGIAAPKTRRPDAQSKRRDFSVKELQRLFDLPLFTGAQGPKWGPLYRPGPVRVSDWRFWVPLICIFSGMRLNEACGLALADIKTEDGIAFFHCRDEMEGQSVKAAASRRRVPVHTALIEIGLLDHVAQLRAVGAARLFDDLKVDSDGYFSGRPSKFFLDLIARIEDDDPEAPGNLVFHSTRHTATTRLRAAGVRMDVSEAIIGHESVSTHSGYGTFDIPTLKAAVDQIVYPRLDLSRLSLTTT
jgi:integrase